MGLFQFGHAGVDLFFVISGFIILYVHYDDIGHPKRLGRYVGRRLTRILPTYWVALTLTILLGLAGGRAFPPISDVAWSATLLPSHNELLLGVAWTLQFEIVFYAVFSILIIHRRVGLMALAIWLAWIGLATLRPGVGGGVPGSLYGVYNLEFFLGMGAGYCVKTYTIWAPRKLLTLGIALFVAAAVAENIQLIDGYTNLSRLIYGVPATIIVLGMAAADRQGLITIPRILQTLGDSSYSIYLFQFLFIGVIWKLWIFIELDRNLPHIASFPLLASAGVVGGVVVSRFVEYPLMGWVRHLRGTLAAPRITSPP